MASEVADQGRLPLAQRGLNLFALVAADGLGENLAGGLGSR
jgi:hypothetical protein